MSSLRNSLHRRNHKERSQLSHRSRLGFLEKHKDYVLRARDYHSKQDRIQRLRQKVADRNKDEFYFGMNRERTKGGVHVKERGNAALPTDIVKVLKTQDENYIRTMRSAGLKKIDRLKNRLSVLSDLVRPQDTSAGDKGGLPDKELETLKEAGIVAGSPRGKQKSSSGAKGKHILFAENKSSARHIVKASSTVSHKDAKTAADLSLEPVDLGWKATTKTHGKRKRKAEGSVDEDHQPEGLGDAGTAAKEHRARLMQELAARLVRERQLRYAARELEMQRLMMGKGARRKLRGIEKVEDEEADQADDDDYEEAKKAKKVDEKTWRPRMYKWRLERKR